MKKKMCVAAVPSTILGISVIKISSSQSGAISGIDIAVGFVFFVIIFAVLMLILLIIGKAKNVMPKPKKETIKQTPVMKPVVATVVKTSTETILENSMPEMKLQKVEGHKVAGTSYRIDAIKNLLIENDKYEMSKKELIEMYDLSDGEEQTIYKYDTDVYDAELVEEPENKYDKNAVKVIIDDIHVGYIKQGSCSHIKKLIANNSIEKIEAEIRGGDYKVLSCEYDYDKDKDVYSLKNEKSEIGIKLSIFLK